MIVDLFLRLTVIFIAFMVSTMVTAVMVFYTLRGPIAEMGRSAGGAVSDLDDLESSFDALMTLMEVFASLIGGVTLTAALVPAVLIIMAGEIMRLRSWMVYVLGGGVAMGLAAAVQGLNFHLIDLALPGFALSMVSSGFVGGGIYWLLAGRRAGIRF